MQKTNLAAALKSEIARVARKEIRAEIASIRRAATSHRTDIAELKRQNQALKREVAELRKLVGRAAPPAPQEANPTDSVRYRFTSERFAAHRAKLGLSAADFGLLLGASPISVYKWEAGTHPRARFMAAIAAVSKMGKREAAARLAELK